MNTSGIDVRALSKENAARAALDMVENGMILGLGSGSTAELFVRLLGEKLAETGWKVRGAPTSENTRALAEKCGVPLLPIDQVEQLHLTIDGADEVDPALNLIKGGGGCHLREKIIADASDYMAVIVDEAKLVDTLGGFPLPVEVTQFGFTITAKKVFDALVESRCAGREVTLRTADGAAPFITDGGNFILDCAAQSIPDAAATAARLAAIPGVVEHGLFLGLADAVIVGAPDGVEMLER